MSKQSLKVNLTQVAQMSPTRGISKDQLGKIIRYINHHPENLDAVFDALRPHMGKLGEQALGQVGRSVIMSNPEKFGDFVAVIPSGPAMVRHMVKLTAMDEQPKVFFHARARLVEDGSEDQLVEFDQCVARRALVRALYMPQKLDLLEAVLHLPEGNSTLVRIYEHTFDWVEGLVYQAFIQTTSMEIFHKTLQHLVDHRVQMQEPGQGCRALVIASQYRDKSIHSTAIINHLLTAGAQWRGLGFEEDKYMWSLISEHPRVRSDMLMEISQASRRSVHPSSRKPAM